MMKHEVDALLGYLEFNLTSMVENIQKKLPTTLADKDIGVLYDEAYEVLYEIERTLSEQLQDQKIMSQF